MFMDERHLAATAPAPEYRDYVLAAGADGGAAAFAVVRTTPAATGLALLSRLAADGAESGARILRASASALETDFQLGIVRQLFELPLTTASARDQDAWLRGPAVLVPQILGLRGDETGTGGTDDHSAAHAVFWLAANMSLRRPLILMISDLQWADSASLRWLVHLVLRMSALPIAVVATLESGHPGSDDAGLVAALLAEVRRMPGPGPGLSGPGKLVTACLDATFGPGAPIAAASPPPVPEPGSRRSRGPKSGPLALTPHERRLITMAVNGVTNGEIAQHFGVTRRAVEFHFTQIYRKLGIDRRPQLYRFAAG
jgi:DNA-binding CsgD family transcriptional regulator